MEGLRVIVDISGSMSALGKFAVVSNALTTLSRLPPEFGNVQLAKHSWNGQVESLLTLLQQDAGMPTLVLTDGFALVEAESSQKKKLNEAFSSLKETLFVVLCGTDAVSASVLQRYGAVQSVAAENILYAVEVLSECCSKTVPENNEEDWQ